MISKLLVLALSLASIVSSSPAPARRWLNFGYGLGEKVRGVNLGGWFVLEPYINYELFNAFGDSPPVDEYHFCQVLGATECANQLTAHWASWITQDDFVAMQAAGLNHVRIPVGYWAFMLMDGDPYVQGQLTYLEQALQWAREANIKVWIDIHGMPGSQNGFDNSGLRDNYAWQTEPNYSFSFQVLDAAITRYSAAQWNDVVTAIQPVNEPLGTVLNDDEIRSFYLSAYSELRDTAGSDIVLAIHDAFLGMTSWNGFMTYPDYYNVILDHHSYQVFDQGQIAMDITAHVASACSDGALMAQTNLWSVMGEWSAALTDCATWLNGVGRGARYDGSYESSQSYGSCATRWDFTTWSDDDKANTRRYIEAQMDAFETGLGWFFWCWKTNGNAIEWDFQFLLEVGLIPQPLDARTYPGQC
ncbi:glycoside hydrolase superfamily [Lipomyces oligophaga]|uniref:glycoside hydrolase superfamily n=1 Tax=Lipomyces oligophaga TaxID=45792 RepID=UPI0034CF23FB